MTKIVDLRSNTVTRPTPGMLAAMAAAEVGDDVWGDDPTANGLQAMMAEATNKEGRAIFSVRHSKQPRRVDVALRTWRQLHRGPDGAHLPLGRRRCGGARKHPTAAA